VGSWGGLGDDGGGVDGGLTWGVGVGLRGVLVVPCVASGWGSGVLGRV